MADMVFAVEPSPRLPEINVRSISVESYSPRNDPVRFAFAPREFESSVQSEEKPEKTASHKSLKTITQWQFWVFDVLPVLMAVGISIEVFFLSKYREVAEAHDNFFFTSKSAHTSLRLALQNAAENALLLLGDLLAHTDHGLPSTEVFEKMAYSNPFFNMDGTVAKVIMLTATANASSLQYPVWVVPDMKASWGGQPSIPVTPSFIYYPVHFVSPPQPELIGMDFNADPINGPYLRLADGTGKPVITHTFQLRGGIPGRNDYIEFRNGMVYQMPIFESIKSKSNTNVFTSQKTGPMRGALLFVLWITGIMEVTMKQIGLQHTDVFLFDITTPDDPSYVAHYESPELDTRPFYNKTNVTTVTPFTVEGDFVTPFTKDYDMQIAQRNYRMVMRGRTGLYANRFATALPYILLGLSLGVKFLDKFMHFIQHKWCSKHAEKGDKI